VTICSYPIRPWHTVRRDDRDTPRERFPNRYRIAIAGGAPEIKGRPLQDRIEVLGCHVLHEHDRAYGLGPLPEVLDIVPVVLVIKAQRKTYVLTTLREARHSLDGVVEPVVPFPVP
jgi:hypothetical protein